MFGYATDETVESMPLTHVLAHALIKRLNDLRKDGQLWWARPDAKAQVSDFFRSKNVKLISFGGGLL